MRDLVGTIVRGYELQERIGAGSFGVVYRAHQASMGRDVAVKVILPDLASEPEFIHRFEMEASLVARLEHPNITPLHDYWRDPGGAYLIMRLLRGGNLHTAIQNRPYNLESAALLLDQITAALHVAHRNHVIHRDLKPENILLDEDGNAYLADFGIAKHISGPDGNDDQPDPTTESPDYLAPEQVRGDAVSPMTDIYALGIVLYEALVGQPPFQDVSRVERLYKQLDAPLPPITHFAPEVTPSLNEVLQKATAKNPAHRYPDGLAFAAAFRQAVGLNRPRAGNNIVETLTLREQAVLQQIIQGKSNREIAQELYVTVSTVKWYIKQVYGKLGVRSRVQAIIRARELDLIASGQIEPGGQAVAGTIPLPTEPENPYKGLRSFQTADCRDFFGRDQMVQKLIERMGEVQPNGSGAKLVPGEADFARFLAIVGPSGSGKSSLVKAGLIPALWRGLLPGSERWFVAEMVPGSRPVDELEIALTHVAANYSTSLREHLQRDEYGLLRAAQLILPNDGSELVLLIDQFEELFTLVEDEAARVHILDNLIAAITDPRSRVRVVITLRADFYDRPLHYAQFGEMMRSRMITLLPLTADGLEYAIARPAEQVGVTFEPGLVASIVAEVNYQPGALPLLQYALTELFRRRVGRVLTCEAYQAMGGTVGALTRRADEIYESQDEAGREAVRQLFLRLVTLGEGTEDTRRRVPRSELMAISADEDLMDDLLDTYASFRLLSFDHNPTNRAPTVEIAHEALIRAWGYLSNWLAENREDLRVQRRLIVAATEWAVAKSDPSYLATGVRLTQFETLALTAKLALSEQEQAYLDASIVQRQRRNIERETQQRSVLRLQRGIIGMLVVFVITSAALSCFALISRNEALSQARSANARQWTAQAVAELRNPIGNDEFAALLAIRALNYQYDSVADGALAEAASRLPLRAFSGHEDVVYDATFSPDGHYVLTASADHTARLWDAATGREIRTFAGHDGEVYSAVVSPDGHYALTAGADHTARLWEVANGQEVHRFSGHRDEVYDVAFSPDGSFALTGSEDDTIRLWDVATGQQVRAFRDSELGRGIAFSPDGCYVLTSGDGYTARLWDVTTGEIVRTLRGHTNWIYTVAFSPDGNYIVTGAIDNTAKLWETATGREVRSFQGHSSSVRSVAFSPDGRYVLTGSADHTARLWDVATGQEVHSFRSHWDRVWSVAFSPNGEYVLTGSADHSAKLWDTTTQQGLGAFIGHRDEVYDVAFSPDGQYALTGSADRTARIWDAATGRQVRTLSGHDASVYGVAFSPDGQHALTGSEDATVKLWDVATGQEVRSFGGHTGPVWSVAFSLDGHFILTGSADATAKLWDIATGQEVRSFIGHRDDVYSVTFSPDGQSILTGGADDTAQLWDVATGQVMRLFSGHNGPVYDAVFSPDGQFVLTSSTDTALKLWAVATGQEVRSFSGHTGTVYNAVFSSDGRRILSGSADRTARLWDVASGNVLRILRSHQSAVWGVAFSADGNFALTGSLDRTAHLWETDYHDFADAVCLRLVRDFTSGERAQVPIADQDPTCPQIVPQAG